jgi:hypothetical protein
MQKAMPGKTVGQIADLESALRSRVPGKIEQVTSHEFMVGIRPLIESGAMTPEEALSMGTLALQKDMSLRTIRQFATKATEKIEPTFPRSREDADRNRLARMPPAQRAWALLSNEALQAAGMGPQVEGSLHRITADEVRAGAAALVGEQGPRGAYSRELATPAMAAARARAQAAWGKDIGGTWMEEEGKARNEEWERVEAGMRARGAGAMGHMVAGGLNVGINVLRDMGLEDPATVTQTVRQLKEINANLTTTQATAAAQNSRKQGE